ncbi:MAG: NAD+ synthase [Verrucomicrobiales bacterium]|jgi:NAD+ synthetase|nr:NAD+ synthase [Verrucomicrobiales bacterium]|tara:strand:+ start:3150 stop:4778 length:1629 start_codon:yes stop_codon:yes gene_type:complete
MKIGIAQMNSIVGDLSFNADEIISRYQDLVSSGADLVITPELSVTGYPPRDLIFRSKFIDDNLKVIEKIAEKVGNVPIVVGCIDYNTQNTGNPFENAAVVIKDHEIVGKVTKCLLPSYDVFDETRYFEPSKEVQVQVLSGMKIGITICEDIWSEDFLPSKLYVKDPAGELAKKGIDCLVNLSASPYHMGKPKDRHAMLSFLARRIHAPVVYCNSVGGNDELIFDGNSLAFSADGELISQGASFESQSILVDTESTKISVREDNQLEEIYNALVLGLRDYVTKCGFRSALIGLSGGIDSALTAVIAERALGADNVYGVTMPSEFSSSGSVNDSLSLAENLGIGFEEVPIKNSFATLKAELSEVFQNYEEDITEENMQARIRGLFLMSISNKKGHLLLTTGNKSELAVGYCTIYGDMCGGLAVISDLPKTLVYKLAKWINRKKEIIPWETIEKAPSAELKPNQKDQDTLPDYEILDQILELYVDQSISVSSIIAKGYDKDLVKWIASRVEMNEWKRWQSAPGLRVTSKAFGVGRRIPIAHRYKN